MSASIKLVSSVAAAMSIVAAIAMFQNGSTIQDVAKVLLVLLGLFGTLIFVAARFTSDRQPVASHKQPTQAKSRAQATVFGILAGATLVVSLQQLVNPVHSTDRTLGGAGVITALFIAFLAFRAYRNMKTEQTNVEGDVLQPRPKQRMELGNPKAVLIGIIIFGLLFVAGNLRRIMSARSNDVWIGIGLGIPAKANADSRGNANGIPGRRRTVLGA